MEPNEDVVRVQLSFPLERVKEPIIWHLSHDFGLKFSIRRASIDVHAGGWCMLELSGPREQIDAGLEWVRQQDVEVSAIGVDGADEWVVR